MSSKLPANGVAVAKSVDGPEQPTVVVGVAQNGATNGAVPPGQDWSTGVFDCGADTGNCWDTCLCHPCMVAMLFNKLTNDRSSVNWPVCLSVGALDILLTGGLALMAEALYVRLTIRSRYHLHSASDGSDSGSCLNFFTEFLLVLFCLPCTTCQSHREMTLHDEWPGKLLFGRDPALATEQPTEVAIE